MSTPNPSNVTKSPRKRIGRILLWIGVGIAALFLIAYFGIGAYAANALTQPKRQFDPEHDPSVYDMDYEETTFQSRDSEAEIAAWFIPNQDSQQVVIMVHGNNASRTREFDDQFPSMAAALHDAGLNVLMIDLRGHGGSSAGRVTFGTRERQDVFGAVDWLQSRGFQPGSIGVLGVSLGSAASIGATDEEPAIGALVVDSAFAEIYPVIQEQWQGASGLPNLFLTPTRLMIRLLYGYDLAGSKPVEEIGGIAPRPMMIIHCKTDAYIPVEHAQRLSEAAPGAEVWLLEVCDHARTYNTEKEAYESKVSRFFSENLK
jgi:pimeloyl-ACP methyl ester carboxylesterase